MDRKLTFLLGIFLLARTLHAATPVSYSVPLSAGMPLTNATVAENDFFGRSCAMSENYLLVGFEQANHNGGYILYQRTPEGTWERESVVQGSGGRSYGRALAINRQVMAVGQSGAVTLKAKNAMGNWESGTTFRETEVTRSFGSYVAVDGSTVAVGAYDENFGKGRVYLYTNSVSANKWYHEATINPPTDGDGFFGLDLDIHNGILAVGAFEANAGLNDAGEVSVYQRVDGTWTLIKKMNSDATRELDAEFGRAVALSDRWLMISDRGDVSGNSDAGRTHVYDLSQDDWPYVQTLTDSVVQARARFGDQVAVDGNLAVISSPDYDDGAKNNAGRACLFYYDGSTWSNVRELPWPTAEDSDFGCAVALKRNHLVCGACALDDPETYAGKAFVYDVNQGDFKTSTTATDYMGDAVAISQNRMAVGVKGAEWKVSNAGKVMVYRRQGTEWQHETTLVAAAPRSGDMFGWEVAMAQNSLMASAIYADPNEHTSAGQLTFFTRDGTTWTRNATINGTGNLEYLGRSIAIDDNRAAASYQTGIGNYPDALRTMQKKDGTFTLDNNSVFPPVGYTGDINFGSAIAISGDLMAVGADEYHGNDYGAVFFYRWNGSEWVFMVKQIGTVAGERLGNAIAIKGDYIAVGAKEARSDLGWVRIYKYDGDSISYVSGFLAPDGLAGDHFGSSVAFSRNYSLLVGAYSKNGGGTADAGAIYRFDKNGSAWDFVSITYPPRKAGVDPDSTYFGKDVAVEGDTVVSGMYTFDDGALYTGAAVVYEIKPRVAPADFDGDGITDIGCYYAPQGYWYVYKSEAQDLWVNQFGYDGTTPFVADFDGDWITDFGCFDSSSSLWFFYGSSDGFSVNQFGNAGTTRITGDFDGDGLADYGVFNASIPKFYFMCSTDGYKEAAYGTVGSEPITGDFDGDGIDDYGTYYAPSGAWDIQRSTAGSWSTQFGYAGTEPITGDFDGDGTMDFGCYYPPAGAWYIYKSTEGFWDNNFGYDGTTPVTGDFDGDGVDDFGCYFPPIGAWYIYKSTEGFWVNNFGYSGTVPMN